MIRRPRPFLLLMAALSVPLGATVAAAALQWPARSAAVPGLSLGNGSLVEGSGGTTSLVFGVSLSQPITETVSVQYQTVDGSATTADGDYLATTGTLSINPLSPGPPLVWGTQGTGSGAFQNPYGLAVAPGGDVFVADRDNHRIQRFNATGAYAGQWGSYGAGPGQFAFPQAVAVNAIGHVYVVDTGNHRIGKFRQPEPCLPSGEPGAPARERSSSRAASR